MAVGWTAVEKGGRWEGGLGWESEEVEVEAGVGWGGAKYESFCKVGSEG